MRFKRFYIEITNVCNLNCSFCSKTSRSPKEMSPDEFGYVISEVSRFTDHIYLHVKGEPLAHSQIDNILTICDSFPINVNITTNGTLLRIKKDILKKHKTVRQLNISLHSAENAVEAEKYLNGVLSSADELSKYFMISLRLWTVENPDAANELILKKLSEKYPLDLSKNRSVLSENIFLHLSESFEWPSLKLPDYGENGFCQGTRTQMAVLSNGDVVPCCLDAEGIICFGNIFKSALNDILQSERFIKMSSNLKNRKLTEELCRHCSYRLRF